jgi:hypothetical protein
MKALPVFFLLAICVACTATAQSVKLINSTHQRWSGGVAGRSGDRYGFTIEFSKYKKEPVPDTLWIGKKPFAIKVGENNSFRNGNTKLTRSKNKLTLEINENITKNEYYNPNEPPQQQPNTSQPPKQYNGVALLSYTYKGHHHYFEVSRIMNEAQAANYP